VGLFRAGNVPKALAPIFIKRRDGLPCRRWSWSNQLITALHGYADARGFRQWEQAGRHVKKGERAFDILAPRTRNFYMKALKAFFYWMVSQRRASDNPLARMKAIAVTDETKRRALMDDELAELIRVAREGPPVCASPGPERAVLYQLGAATGFRFSECRSLTWGCARLAGDRPTITVLAAYSKHRRDDEQPVGDDLVKV
jgi:integrase